MKQNRIVTYLYRFSIFMLIISGFGQMPVFKRYYIADIPGFAWLAQFYTTHFIHYISAIVFIFFISYFTALNFNAKKKRNVAFFIKAGLFAGLVFSGFLLVIRNFSGYRFSELFITVVNLVHLGLVAALLTFLAVLFIYNFRRDNKEVF